jgi:hypothetical protein
MPARSSNGAIESYTGRDRPLAGAHAERAAGLREEHVTVPA